MRMERDGGLADDARHAGHSFLVEPPGQVEYEILSTPSPTSSMRSTAEHAEEASSSAGER